jgi:hypothetical protein
MRWLGLAIVLFVAFGCQSGQQGPTNAPSQAANIQRPIDPLSVYADVNDATPALVMNGLLGIRLGRDGMGLAEAPSFWRIDRYQLTGEEKIEGLPSPLLFDVTMDGKPILDAGSAQEYEQKINFKIAGVSRLSTMWQQDGVRFQSLTTLPEWGWSVKQSLSMNGGAGRKIRFKINLAPGEKLKEIVAVGSKKQNLFEGKGAATNVLILTNCTVVNLEKSESAAVCEVILGDRPAAISLERLYVTQMSDGVNEPPAPDIEIDGPVDDQQAIRSMIAYLRGSISLRSREPISPLSVSGQTYNGHMFWDADVWVFPALCFLDPDRAAQIPRYRILHASAARKNFAEARSWITPGKPFKPTKGFRALQYPWESSISGLEVSPTETRQQHHISGSVLFALDKAAALNLADTATVRQIGKEVAEFYRWRSVTKPVSELDPSSKAPKDMQFETIENTISPDEFFRGDHDLYTNCVAEWARMNYGSEQLGNPYYRPSDGQSYLNYGGDRLRGYKQAAGVLAIFPLQDPSVEAQARPMMNRFADKITRNGPAMTESVHATIWARLGDTDKAYEVWRKSWGEFTNHPLMLFSEKRSKDVTYFTTGAGGCLQTVVYGFLGFRLDYRKVPGSAWSIPLKNGRWLSVKPNLPKAWKKVTVKNLSILGKRYTLTATHDRVDVTLGEK